MNHAPVFIASSSRFNELNQGLAMTLQELNMDVWTYAWSQSNPAFNSEALSEFYKRPITILLMSQSDVAVSSPSEVARRLRSIIAYNPTRLVLAYPVEKVSEEDWTRSFPFFTYSPIAVDITNLRSNVLTRLALGALDIERLVAHSSSEVIEDVIKSLICQHRYEDALHVLQKVIVIFPAYSRAWVQLGCVYAQLHQWDECLRACAVALDTSSERSATFYYLGQGYNGLEEYEKAFNAFHRSLSTYSQHTAAWLGQGIALARLQRYQEALNAFDHVLGVHQQNVWAYEDDRNKIEARTWRLNMLHELGRTDDVDAQRAQ